MQSTTKSVDTAAAASLDAEETTGSFPTEEKEAAACVGSVPELTQDVEAGGDGDGDGGDCPAWMTWTQFVVAYKRLSLEEIDSILSRQRKPFESTVLYKDMIEDSSTTKEDLEREAADHEYLEDGLSAWRDRVRREYAEKGIFAVDDEYIAERLEMEEYCNQSLRQMLDELNLDESIFGYEGLVIKTRTSSLA